MRLIDADKLIRCLRKDPLFKFVEQFGVTGVIDAQPTVDAEPVIRCKDCKYAKKIYLKNLPWLKLWEYSCQYFNTHSVMGDGYCNNAERKEE